MGTDVEIMSERATMERMYNDISDIRREQSEMKSDVAEIKNDISWIKLSIDNFNTKFSGCKVCSDPEEVIENHSKLKKIVYDLRDRVNGIYWWAAAVASTITMFILILQYIKNNIST